MQISQCFYLQIGNSQFSTPFISGNLAPSWIFQLWVLTPVTLPGKQKILLSRICPLWWTRSVDSKEQVIYKTLSSTARIWLANWEGRREKKGRERGEEMRRKQKEIKVNLPLPSLIASFSTINPPFHLSTPSPGKKKKIPSIPSSTFCFLDLLPLTEKKIWRTTYTPHLPFLASHPHPRPTHGFSLPSWH